MSEQVFKYFTKLLKRLQKKPVAIDMLESDWDMFKYHMTYLLLCTAIAEMEKCLNYKSWGLEPPNAPPGPEEEYEGTFVQKYEDSDIDDEETGGSDTEEDEAILARIEKEMIKKFGDDALDNIKTINLNLGLGIRFSKDDRTRAEIEVDQMEEEGETEEEAEEEHIPEVGKNKYSLEEIEEEQLYEEEMSEEEMSLSLESEDNGENSEEEELSEINHTHEESVEEDIEEEEEEGEEEEEEEEDDDDDEEEWKIVEKKVISAEKEKEYVENIVEKIKLKLTSPPDKGIKKADQLKKKEPESKQTKPQSKQTGKDEQKQQKGIVPDTQKPEEKVQEPITEIPPEPQSDVDEDSDSADYFPLRVKPSSWARKHFLFFAKIQWRQILADTIDDIAVLIESINFTKGESPKTNIKYSDRAHYSC